MRITDLLDKRSISLNGAPKSKEEALDQVVALMTKSGKINDEEAYRKQVYAREEESTTGIGEGIAIPHGKCDAVDRPGLAAMVVKNGVDFDALDGEPVTLIFLIAAPNTEDNVRLDVLSKLSVLMMDEDFSDSLRNAGSVEEFLEIIDKADDEKPDIDQRLAEPAEEQGERRAYEGMENSLLADTRYYLAYMGLRKNQFAILCRMRDCFSRMESTPDQALVVADLLQSVSGSFHERNNALGLLDELEHVKLQMKAQPLPVRRQEFESRALLYLGLLELEQFLVLKKEFALGLSRDEIRRFWGRG